MSQMEDKEGSLGGFCTPIDLHLFELCWEFSQEECHSGKFSIAHSSSRIRDDDGVGVVGEKVSFVERCRHHCRQQQHEKKEA
ncbi:hypothetical protein DMENIID0001_118780 [Sergentomyia squamirostris]